MNVFLNCSYRSEASRGVGSGSGDAGRIGQGITNRVSQNSNRKWLGETRSRDRLHEILRMPRWFENRDGVSDDRPAGRQVLLQSCQSGLRLAEERRLQNSSTSDRGDSIASANPDEVSVRQFARLHGASRPREGLHEILQVRLGRENPVRLSVLQQEG